MAKKKTENEESTAVAAADEEMTSPETEKVEEPKTVKTRSRKKGPGMSIAELAQAEENIRKISRTVLLNEKAANTIERSEKNSTRQHDIAESSSLESIMRNGMVIEAVIAGVEEMSAGDGRIICASGFTTHEDSKVKILIPFDEVFPRQVMDMRSVNLETATGRREYIKRQKQMLTKMLGLRTAVCITDIVEGKNGRTEYAMASRKLACRKLVRSAFIDNRRVIEGEIYNATVVCVSPHAVVLNYAGIENVIPQAVLTERFLVNLGTHYRIGQKVEFVARDIKIEDDDVTMTFDTKTAELVHALERQESIPLRTIARGTISRIRKSESGKIGIYVWLPDWELPAVVPFMDAGSFGREPRAGDDVLVIVSGYKTNGFLEARINSISGSAGILTHY